FDQGLPASVRLSGTAADEHRTAAQCPRTPVRARGEPSADPRTGHPSHGRHGDGGSCAQRPCGSAAGPHPHRRHAPTPQLSVPPPDGSAFAVRLPPVSTSSSDCEKLNGKSAPAEDEPRILGTDCQIGESYTNSQT